MTSGSITTKTTATNDLQRTLPSEEVIYKPWDLLIHEVWVLGIVSTWAWGCSTSEDLLPQFRASIGKNHLDIGSGTGYYLRQGEIPATTLLALLDLEHPARNLGLQRCGRPDACGLQADILQPLPVTDTFDSVSMYYLLHCIPATMAEICAIFKHIKRNMTLDGIIHGASVLGKGVRKDNCFAAHVRRSGLNTGIFHNTDDNAYDFEHALPTNFEEVETRVVGSVFMFRASKPKQKKRVIC